jgi:endoglucanase
MPAFWDNHWGYIKKFKNNTVVLGEWASPLDATDRGWGNKFLNYLVNEDMRNNFYWALNPASNNGGLLLNWTTPDQKKFDFLAKLQPNPTKFTHYLR